MLSEMFQEIYLKLCYLEPFRIAYRASVLPALVGSGRRIPLSLAYPCVLLLLLQTSSAVSRPFLSDKVIYT